MASTVAAAGFDIQPLSPASSAAARALLEHYALPVADLETSGVQLLVAGDAEQPQGLIGLQLCADHGLLRSLAVAPEHTGRGLARALVGKLEARARGQGLVSLWLLTTTAADFFRHIGYRDVARSLAPPAIAASAEFSSLCGATAACLYRDLQAAAADQKS